MTRRTFQLEGEPQNNGPANPPVIPNQPPSDLAGYPTTDALVQGYRNSSTEAQRQKARADAAEMLLQQMQTPQTQPGQSPEERLSTIGIPVDALDAVINERMQRAFAPIARGMTARTQVMAQYPDYNKYEQDVAKYIDSDPGIKQTYNELFNANPVGAFEYAFLKFGENQRRTQPPTNGAGNASEKANAQIPTGGGSTQTRQRQETSGDEYMQKAFEHYKKTGDPKAYAKARLRQAIPDSFFEK